MGWKENFEEMLLTMEMHSQIENIGRNLKAKGYGDVFTINESTGSCQAVLRKFLSGLMTADLKDDGNLFFMEHTIKLSAIKGEASVMFGMQYKNGKLDLDTVGIYNKLKGDDTPFCIIPDTSMHELPRKKEVVMVAEAICKLGKKVHRRMKL